MSKFIKCLMRLLLATICVTAVACISLAGDSTATMKQEAEKYAQALVTTNFEVLARYTHPRIVKAVGGKEAMIALLSSQISPSRARTGPVELVVGQPEAPQKAGQWTTSFVPARLVLKAPGGGTRSYNADFFGISEDAGKSWVFLDAGSISGNLFKRLFPELVGKITVPAHRLKALETHDFTNGEAAATPNAPPPHR